MTISDIVKQIKTLSPQERKELAKLLIDMMDAPQEIEAAESTESIDDWMPTSMTFKELAAWLNANPASEPWGDLRDDEDAGEYVHRMRRQSTIWLDEPGETE